MGKNRVSLTLEESLLEKIDREAEQKDLNRSQTVEGILQDYFQSKGIDTAVVLCGDPDLKSLELYKGQAVLAHVLEHLATQGISRVILLSGQNKERIKKEFGDSYEGLSLEYMEEESPRGTAAALERVEPELGNKTFVLLNGHVITDVGFDEMLRVHNDQSATATIALTTVENPSKYGVARLKGQKILGFEEKPEKGEEPSRLINAGTYIVSPDIFGEINSDDIEEVFKQLASEKELSGYIYGGKWKDVSE